MPESEFRYADFEIREGANGLGIVTGVIIRYGDVATLPWGTEEFRAGCVRGLQRRSTPTACTCGSSPLAGSVPSWRSTIARSACKRN